MLPGCPFAILGSLTPTLYQKKGADQVRPNVRRFVPELFRGQRGPDSFRRRDSGPVDRHFGTSRDYCTRAAARLTSAERRATQCSRWAELVPPHPALPDSECRVDVLVSAEWMSNPTDNQGFHPSVFRPYQCISKAMWRPNMATRTFEERTNNDTLGRFLWRLSIFVFVATRNCNKTHQTKLKVQQQRLRLQEDTWQASGGPRAAITKTLL